MSSWHITTFYRFQPIPDPDALKKRLEEFGRRHELKALIILANEGLNGTAALPSADHLKNFKVGLQEIIGASLDFKDSVSETTPFRKLSIKIRPEIVSLGRPDLRPQGPRRHLNSTEWEQAIQDGAILLDTRNLYESRIGTFRGAVVPAIERFEQFPQAVKDLALPADQKILIFCTGGIRCEKAILALEELGHRDVHQLEGGILRYFEETGGRHWDGECFVFDDRVAVTKELEPTARYQLCPHCGHPADKPVTCDLCGSPAVLCFECAPQSPAACSKNCRHHLEK